MNDIVSDMSRDIKAALFADDLLLWCSEDHATTARYRMQQAVEQLTALAAELCVDVNMEKSCLVTQTESLGYSDKWHLLTEVDEATYLGATWKQVDKN